MFLFMFLNVATRSFKIHVVCIVFLFLGKNSDPVHLSYSPTLWSLLSVFLTQKLSLLHSSVASSLRKQLGPVESLHRHGCWLFHLTCCHLGLPNSTLTWFCKELLRPLNPFPMSEPPFKSPIGVAKCSDADPTASLPSRILLLNVVFLDK